MKIKMIMMIMPMMTLMIVDNGIYKNLNKYKVII
jgi:hypothetical protein